MKHKHLSFEERCIIEENLNKGMSVHRIAIQLKRPDSSIIREIKRNRSLVYSPATEVCMLYEGLDLNIICPQHRMLMK